MQSKEVTDASECRAKLAELIQDMRYAMLTTANPDGSLHSRPMAAQQKNFSGELWFFTGRDSGKVAAIQSDQNVNVAYAEPDKNRYLSIAGRAQLVDDKKKAEEMWNPAYRAWFPDGLEDPNLALLKISVESAEFWDAPASLTVHLIGFAKAMATGQPYKTGSEEHGRVELRH